VTNSKPQTWENEPKNKGFSLREPGVLTIGLKAPTIAVGEATPEMLTNRLFCYLPVFR
jgi:hypothetical protein